MVWYGWVGVYVNAWDSINLLIALWHVFNSNDIAENTLQLLIFIILEIHERHLFVAYCTGLTKRRYQYQDILFHFNFTFLYCTLLYLLYLLYLLQHIIPMRANLSPSP